MGRVSNAPQMRVTQLKQFSIQKAIVRKCTPTFDLALSAPPPPPVNVSFTQMKMESSLTGRLRDGKS